MNIVIFRDEKREKSGRNEKIRLRKLQENQHNLSAEWPYHVLLYYYFFLNFDARILNYNFCAYQKILSLIFNVAVFTSKEKRKH